MSKELFSMTITMDKKTAELLEKLKGEFSASSKAEIIRKAIALLEIAGEAKANGEKLEVVNTERNERQRIVLT